MVELLPLPEGVEEKKSWSPSYRAGDFVLRNYCTSCVLQPTCNINQSVRTAMAENYPGWPEAWVPLRFRTDSENLPKETYICKEYDSRQKSLFEQRSGQSAIERLTTLITEGKFVNHLA
ncbi:hypothetical protein J4423_03795 [Candidatus Pacearchaeota archaeon]|nr:hypothetical protein [Candidatus Pacearchaeota archaeon]